MVTEIAGYSAYTLDRDGNVYSKFVKGGCGKLGCELSILQPVLDKGTGYYIVSLIGDDGRKSNKSIHRLLAQSFIPNPENKAHVNHIDGVKTNNSLDNLEWNTPKENTQHAIRLGLKVRGGGVRVARLDTVSREVLQEYEYLSDAARDTGAAFPNILKVCKGLRKSAGGYSWMFV